MKIIDYDPRIFERGKDLDKLVSELEKIVTNTDQFDSEIFAAHEKVRFDEAVGGTGIRLAETGEKLYRARQNKSGFKMQNENRRNELFR